ncbi:MAG TPA: 4-hydroxythreonine-4-phosphate dehydrogenase PdxA [Moheibacter sp.]|nr:4-hydroxythreonine-4-phosphate dehydrogenase PdxA [Moheibacter sp.]
MNLQEHKPKVAISVGDTNGIGYEIIVKTLTDKNILDFFTPVIFGSTKHLNFYKNLFKDESLQFFGINSADKAVERKINVVNLWKDSAQMEFGNATETSGKLAFESLKSAAEAVKNGECDILVTAPINKKNIQSEEFNFPGHTEYLGEIWGGKPLMFLVTDTLKVSLVTQHIPLKDVVANISKERIIEKIKALHESLKVDFGIRKPKIAVLGLNPHSGDNGLLGQEEQEIIIPAIQSLYEKGMLVFGPYAADSFFSTTNLEVFDAVLGMYHDQALIPFKTLCFEDGVNYTASLPFVRTSPDHGVAYDIAGKGIADETSFREAIYTAINIYQKRAEYKELTSNVLKHRELKPERER